MATSIGDIADAMSIDASTASRFVERAVQQDFLERRPCSEDRRRTRLLLTKQGRGLLRSATKIRRTIMGEVTAGWKTEDVAAFVRLSNALIEGFEHLDSA